MKSLFSLPTFKKSGCKTQSITEFCGYDKTKIKDGMLLDAENVTVLSGGALSSMLAYKKVDIEHDNYLSPEGIYTFSGCYDGDYETFTDVEWVYEYICPKHALRYEEWQTEDSRLIIKTIGKPPKTEEGYRDVISAFFDGKNTFVFYTAEYNIIDERRKAELDVIDDSQVWQFDSTEGSVRICRFVQIYLDIINESGEVYTFLIDGVIRRIKSIKEEKYKRSTIISEGDNDDIYKYASPEYSPDLGEPYPIYYDSVYTDYYPILETFELEESFKPEPKRLARYNNLLIAFGDDYMEPGEKILILPDMKLLKNENNEWLIHDEINGNIPEMSAAVQQFDRLYGFYGDTVYVSTKGDCTDYSFSSEEQTSLPTDAWTMVTTDVGGFTAIAAFDGKVAVFTKNSMLTIKGNELPFSLSQEADCGCYSQEAVAVCEGVLYFVSRNGIMSYSKNTLKCISRTFEKGIDYSKVKLAETNGAIIAALNDSGKVRIYEPSNGQWSTLSIRGDDIVLTGRHLIVPNGEFSKIYKMSDSYGEFSFKIALNNIGRRRIKSITVTANVGADSKLMLLDENGKAIMNMLSSDGGIASRTCYPRGIYFDHGVLSFGGSGDVKLYGIFIEYENIHNVAARKG